MNVKESEGERSGVIRRQFCGARQIQVIFPGALKLIDRDIKSGLEFPSATGTGWEQPMKKSQRIRTRRQLLRATAVSAASIPFLALAQKAASAHPDDNPGNHWGWDNDHRHTNQSCFLKGTKISTPSGDRLVQEL